MKRETLRHPKTHDLASRLGCERPTALGYLMLLWDLTAEVAIAGDIGKWPNGAISGGCDWRGDADRFIRALVDSGWLDEDEEHRLVIHDWGQHCENWVRAKAQKLGIRLLGCDVQSQTHKSGTQEPNLTAGHKSGSFSRDRTEPNQSNPIPVPVAGDLTISVGRNGRSKTRKPLDKIDIEDLHDSESLLKWFDWQAKQPNAVLPATEENRLLVFSVRL